MRVPVTSYRPLYMKLGQSYNRIRAIPWITISCDSQPKFYHGMKNVWMAWWRAGDISDVETLDMAYCFVVICFAGGFLFQRA